MKSYDDIMKDLNTIFHTVFQNNTLIISPTTTAADIKEWDSLAHMNLIAEIEAYFNCEFSFEEVVNFKSIGDVVQTIQKKKA